MRTNLPRLGQILPAPRPRRAHDRGEIFRQRAENLRARFRHCAFDNESERLFFSGEILLGSHAASLSTSRLRVNLVSFFGKLFGLFFTPITQNVELRVKPLSFPGNRE